MAVRVQTQDDVAFGIMAAAVNVTHVRFQKAGANPVVKALASTLSVVAGRRLRVPSGDFDVVYPANELTNAHLRALIDPYWDGETFQLDCMTSSTVVVSDANYSQQTYSNWAISNESD